MFVISAFYLQKGAGGSGFASRHFPKSVTLACCNIPGRPFVACYACSIVLLFFSLPPSN